MTRALKLIPPTTVAVLRAMEIVLAYIAQVIVIMMMMMMLMLMMMMIIIMMVMTMITGRADGREA